METSTENAQLEKIFYRDNNVLITQSRFLTGGRTYAMRNISFVANIRYRKSKTLPILLIAFGVLLFAGGEGGIAIGVTLITIGSVILATSKDDFSVKISSNSGDTNALTSKNEQYIQTIVDALNEAIIYRG